jgi:phenylacetate-coenzyme A ligase PaaK-like adenylate-forming protein
MLIVAGVNVWPSSIMDVVGKFSGEVTGALRIFIPDNGPLVAPPLHIKVEAPEFEMNSSLSARLEEAIRGNLQVKSRIELVAPNSLPRFEMKGSYIERGARI